MAAHPAIQGIHGREKKRLSISSTSCSFSLLLGKRETIPTRDFFFFFVFSFYTDEQQVYLSEKVKAKQPNLVQLYIYTSGGGWGQGSLSIAQVLRLIFLCVCLKNCKYIVYILIA